jgi:hypothetical protein
VKVTYKQFGAAVVSTEVWALLTRCRALGWKGTISGRRGGARTYAMQKALWLLFRSGKGASAFNPDAADPHHLHRHMRSNVEFLGGWSNAVDVSDPLGLIAAAKKLGVPMHRPYNPPETWHVEAARPFKIGGGMDTETTRLYNILKAHGIVNPLYTINAARRSKLSLHFACALIEKESGKGHNVFGHDPTIFAGAGLVTKPKYLAYRLKRRQSGNRQMQGVGPCQLTWWATQDTADKLGGCWNPYVNMCIGFAALRSNIQRHGVEKGAAAYNGIGPKAVAYGKDFKQKADRWKAILSA